MGKKRIIKKAGGSVDQSLTARAMGHLPRKHMAAGNLYIQSTYNNTLLTLTDEAGNAVISSSSGSLGFKGAKKGTPFAASKVAELVAEKAKMIGLKEVDIIVSPPLKSLAERISGIGNVFAVETAHSRDKKNIPDEKQYPDYYEKITVLRMSKEAYKDIKKLKSGEIKAILMPTIKYLFHIATNLTFDKNPKTLKNFVSEILLGQNMPDSPIEKIFHFKPEDYEVLKKFDFLKQPEKKVIIHTWANWPMKRWQNDKWVKLLGRINKSGNFKFVFIGQKDDLNNYQYISSRLNFKIESLINKINLAQLALLMIKSDYFIGIDSGPRNLAHLIDLRSITMLGPGPRIFLPTDPRDIVIDKIKKEEILQLYFLYRDSDVRKITPDEVYEKFKKLTSTP